MAGIVLPLLLLLRRLPGWRGRSAALMLAWLAAGLSHAQGSPTPAAPAWQGAPVALLAQAQWLRDPAGQLGVSEVAAAAAARWQPVGGDSLGLGFSGDAIWLRFQLPAAGAAPGGAGLNATPGEAWLVAGPPFLDDLRLYEAPGRPALRAGDHVPVAERPTALREAVFPLQLGSMPRTAYLRLHSSSTLTLQLTLWAPPRYTAHVARTQALQGLLQGLMLTSAVISLLAGLWLRQAFFFIVTAYLLCFGATNAVLNGYDQILLYPATPWWADRSVGALTQATGALLVAFALSFLQPQRALPWLSRVLQGLGGLCALGAAASVAGYYPLIAPWFSRLSLLIIVLLALLFGLMWRHQRQRAALMLAMFLPGVLAVMLQVLRNLGLLPATFWTTQLWELTAFFQMPFTAVVVLLRVRDEQRLLLQAQARERAQRGFLDMMAHELRTPLAVLGTALANIELRTQAAAGGADAAELQPRFRRAAMALARLNTLVDNALAEHRLNEPGITLERQPTRPSALVADVRSLLVMDPPHELRLSLPDDDRPLPLDPHWLGLALLNLLDNAVKYSPGGGPVTLQVERLPGALRLRVSDTGIGVPPEAQGRLFERFYRADNARQLTGVPGLGLGLYLVAEVARRHGGHASVQSLPGQGSHFSIELPDSPG